MVNLSFIINPVINRIMVEINPNLKHNETVSQIEKIFREYKFYTTREYPIYKIKDGSGRSGRIDLVARKGKFRVAVEYDHHKLIKWKSFQKIIQIKPEVAIAISGNGALKPNVQRAMKYKTNIPLYIISLKERNYVVMQK
jgi:hypothetical protein